MREANEVNADNNSVNNKASRTNRVSRASKVSKDNHNNRASRVNKVNRDNHNKHSKVEKVSKVNKVSRDNPDNKGSNKVNSKVVSNNSPAAHRTAAPIAAAASILVHSGDPWAVTGATIDNSPPKYVNVSAKLRTCDASGALPDSAPDGLTK